MPSVERGPVFEANSSSTHSFHIPRGAYVPDVAVLRPDAVGVLSIFPGEFGWGYDRYRDAATKAAYCLTYCGEMPKYGLGSGADEKAMLADVLKKATGAQRVDFCKTDDEFYPDGYIDHQSIEGDGGIGREIFASADTLRDFIFNPMAELVIDNDNH